MAKDRMDRKELRQPDEFMVVTGNAVEWARKNTSTVLAIAGGLAAVFLGAVFYNSYQAAQVRESNGDFASSLSTFASGEYDSAATQLAGVSQRWAETPVGPLAALLEANSQLRAGDADAALTTLGGLPSAGLPSYLAQQRELLWGAALEAQENWAEAASKYAGAAATGGPYTAEAMIGEARCRARTGDSAAARELYQKVVDEYPNRFDKQLLEAKAQA